MIEALEEVRTEEERIARGAGMYEECEQDSDCNSGLMCNRHDEWVLDGRSVEEGKLARGMKCCDGSGCHNYPFGAYFTCENNGGTVSGRSVDSEEEKLARGKETETESLLARLTNLFSTEARGVHREARAYR